MRLCCETWRCREHEARKRILVLITSLAIFPYVLLVGPLRLTEAMRLQPENYNPQKGTGEWLGNGHRWMSGLKRIRQERSFECTKKLVRLARLFTSREARRRTVERGAENWGRSGWGLFSIPVTREKTNCKSDIGPPVSANDHDRAENDARRHPAHRARHTQRWRPQLPLLSMNVTSTLTSNFDDLMAPSEASGKRKASDDNSLNSNGAPKAKRTRKDVSAPILSVWHVLNVLNRILHPTSGNVRV